MPTKIRLQRYGKKAHAYFHIVIADSRSSRDGKFIENIGLYNPNTNPATIEIDFDRALHWVKSGAQPTDTLKAMLSYKGVLLRNHLDRGVQKGSLTKEQADAKFEKWIEEKTAAIVSKKERVANAHSEELKKRITAESAVKEAIAQKVNAKKSELAAEATAAAVAAVTPAETPIAETPAEIPIAETPAAESATPSSEV